jgi:plasmid maintenance system antidote protein VapI
MTMKNPPHPGLSVRHDCIEPLGLTITEAAEILGVRRQTLNITSWSPGHRSG